MRLKKMIIKGFRSFNREVQINFDDFTTFIGPNGSGKTTTFHALLKLFGQTTREREIKYSDFHIPKNISPNTVKNNEFFIEAVIEFNEVNDKKNPIRNFTVPEFFQNFVIETPDSIPYIRIILLASWQKSNQPEGIIESRIKYITTSDAPTEKNMIDASRSHLSQINIMYVPAVRNPEDQLKSSAGTVLWRLMNSINFSESFKSELETKISEVNTTIDDHVGISKIKELLSSEWRKYHNDTRYSDIELKFNNSDLDKILNKIEPHFSPSETGNSNTVEALGDGMRSIFYISLVSTLLESEMFTLRDIIEHPEKDSNDRIFSNQPPLLTILIVEEPENHIATHLLGRVMGNLREISIYDNAQVVLSSHTPAIVKRVDPTEIRHFKHCSSNLCTEVNALLLPAKKDDAFKYIKNAVQAYPELYFSSIVVLGEGDSEEVVLPMLLRTKNIELDKYELSVVPLGGRHVNHMWKLLNQLNITHVTLLDLDIERGGGGWSRIKYCLDQLLANGVTREQLLKNTKFDYQIMNQWEVNTDKDKDDLMSWVEFLENYNIFFSDPLDIDFLMLKHYKENYRKIIGPNEGPQLKINDSLIKISNLTEEQLNSPEYVERIQIDVSKTLKDSSKKGKAFDDDDKELMLWYAYFFLTRGKPSTHLLAFNNISHEEILDSLPPVFGRLIDNVNHKLEGVK